jgi:hypothetical protein
LIFRDQAFDLCEIYHILKLLSVLSFLFVYIVTTGHHSRFFSILGFLKAGQQLLCFCILRPVFLLLLYLILFLGKEIVSWLDRFRGQRKTGLLREASIILDSLQNQQHSFSHSISLALSSLFSAGDSIARYHLSLVLLLFLIFHASEKRMRWTHFCSWIMRTDNESKICWRQEVMIIVVNVRIHFVNVFLFTRKGVFLSLSRSPHLI